MPWIVHRHRRLWDRPDEFVPSRFLPGKRGAIDRYQYLPFGLGPRVCIGQYFAMQEGRHRAGGADAAPALRLRGHARRREPVQKITVQPAGDIAMRISRR